MSHSDGTRCCRWMIAAILFSHRFCILRGRRWINAYNGMASRAFRMSRAPLTHAWHVLPGNQQAKAPEFQAFPIGFFHIDIAAVQTVELKLYLFVGIDRASKFAVTQLLDEADRKTAWEVLEHLLKAVPYRVLTEGAIEGAIGSSPMASGVQFAEQPRNRNSASSREMRFDMICEANGFEPRRTKPSHPWTNGQLL